MATMEETAGDKSKPSSILAGCREGEREIKRSGKKERKSLESNEQQGREKDRNRNRGGNGECADFSFLLRVCFYRFSRRCDDVTLC